MKYIEDAVLNRMTFERLKKHRTSVLAHINKTYFTYIDGVRTPNEMHGTASFDIDMQYRDKVNYRYDAIKATPKF